MKSQKWILLCVALAMIGGAAAALTHLKANQRLGRPGVKASPIAGSQRLALHLPEQVLNYNSELIPTSPAVLEGLPHDTSFLQRCYTAADNPMHQFALNIVLMGTDRTSIHKPQFCLQGSGWDFDDQDATVDTVTVDSPHPYALPVTKIMMTRAVSINGKPVPLRGIFVYWFVADDDITASHWARMRKSAVRLLKTGELERWAYIACLGVCQPGEENAMYERMKQFIAASVPEFQLAAGPRSPRKDARASLR
jgi:Protein of unknown function (DUF3485)